MDIVAGPGGKTITKLKGQWLADGSDLLLKYPGTNGQADVVLKYSSKLSGDNLNLAQAGNGVKSTYHRVSKPIK